MRERNVLPKNRADLIGMMFGDIQVLGFAGVHKSQTYWRCRCGCGKEWTVLGVSIKNGNTKSCGCGERVSKDAVHDKLDPYLMAGTNIAIIRSKKLSINNKSGVRGVHQRKDNGKWVGSIKIDGRQKNKSFAELEDAVRWRREMEELYYKPIVEAFEQARNETE